MQTEKEDISRENEELHLQMQGVISDFDVLKQELENYQNLFSFQPDVSVQGAGNTAQQEQQLFEAMRGKMDELEDSLAEMKQKQGVYKVAEMQSVVIKLEQQILKLT